MEKASFLRRAGAAAIDAALLFLVFYCLARWTAWLYPLPENDRRLVRVVEALVLLLSGTYHTAMVALFGQTVGKAAGGIKVVDLRGEPVSWARALGRWAACHLSALPAGLGFAWALWPGKGRAWHDLLAGTAVVQAEEGRASRLVGVLGGLAAAAVGGAWLALTGELLLGF